MAEVRRFSRSARVVTEVQQDYRPASLETAKAFETFREGFDKGVEFLRPAVTQEQTIKGEKEALEAIDNDSFEMRSPFSISDAAYNKTGELVVSNRAMIELDEEMRNAMRKADGRMGVLNSELERIRGKVGGALPDIPGLKTKWLESFDRGVAASRRQTTELARRRAVAAQNRAVKDAASAVEREVERLALTAGTPEELAAALAQGQAQLAQYGPRGEFELNGEKFKADPSRSGILSERQLATMQTALAANAHELFLEADFQRSESPAQWAEEFQETVLSGNSPLSPSKSLDLLSKFEGKARTEEAARRAEEKRLEDAQRTAADAVLNPYVTALENGVMTAPTAEDRAALFEIAAGNPNLTASIEGNLAAADAVVAMSSMGPDERIAYIEKLQRQFVETPGINAEEAAVINSLAPHLKAAKQAITRETIGVSAAEQMISSGALLSDEQLADLRVRAAGNPEIVRQVEEIAEAQAIITSGEKLTGAQRKEWLDRLDADLAELAIEGDKVGAAAQLRMGGLELAQKHFDTMATAAQEDVTRFAELSGIVLPPIMTEETKGLGEVAAAIAQRVAIVKPATSQFGNDTPVPLSQAERELISDFMRDTNNASRVEFLEQITRMPGREGDAILAALGVDNPALLGAARVRSSRPSASRTILAGMSSTITGATVTARATAEAVIAPVLIANSFEPEELERIRSTAEAYAKGAAVRAGLTEITEEDLKTGYDIALGADEEGKGGIEEVNVPWSPRGFNYGTTVLPTGVTGASVAARLDAIRDEADLDAFAGGVVQDTFGNRISPRSLKRSIAGFRLFDPGDGSPSMLAPMNSAGELFLVITEDGTPMPLAFDPRASDG